MVNPHHARQRATSRDSGNGELIVTGFAVTAAAHAALGHPERAADLLAEVDTTPGTRDNTYYPAG